MANDIVIGSILLLNVACLFLISVDSMTRFLKSNRVINTSRKQQLSNVNILIPPESTSTPNGHNPPHKDTGLFFKDSFWHEHYVLDSVFFCQKQCLLKHLLQTMFVVRLFVRQYAQTNVIGQAGYAFRNMSCRFWGTLLSAEQRQCSSLDIRV